MEYDVHLEQFSSRPTAVIRRRVNQTALAKFVPEACGIVWNVVRAQWISGAGRLIAVYFDDQINLEAGVETDGPFEGYDNVVGSNTPGGLTATTTHYGPYGLLHDAHRAIQRWCRENGYKPAGPQWEIYGHWQEKWNRDPSQIRTDVYYLLVEGESSAAVPMTMIHPPADHDGEQADN